jgi:hypothetical protein
MPINSYFNNTTHPTEQNLVQDLTDEAISIWGHETYYLKRDTVDLDKLLGEDHLSTFTEYYPIEMYIKSSGSFQGQSEFLTKFGLHIEDQCHFSVSTRRWTQAVPDIIRPREGDLIWIQMTPTNRYIFDIRFVENKEQLFQLGKLYTYELRCEVVNFSHEIVNTEIAVIDEVIARETYTPTSNTDPVSITDPIADNAVLRGTANSVVVVRGKNPRRAEVQLVSTLLQ